MWLLEDHKYSITGRSAETVVRDKVNRVKDLPSVEDGQKGRSNQRIPDSYDIVLSPLWVLLHRRRGRSPGDEATRNEYLKPGEGRGAPFVTIIISQLTNPIV